jgi:hypothetical protein
LPPTEERIDRSAADALPSAPAGGRFAFVLDTMKLLAFRRVAAA